MSRLREKLEMPPETRRLQNGVARSRLVSWIARLIPSQENRSSMSIQHPPVEGKKRRGREWRGHILYHGTDCTVVFFHRPTKALITSDLYWNYPKTVPAKTRVWKWGMDKVYLPFFKRFMVTDEADFVAKVNRVLEWGIEVIVPCHGDVVRSGASQALREMLLGAGPHER